MSIDPGVKSCGLVRSELDGLLSMDPGGRLIAKGNLPTFSRLQAEDLEAVVPGLLGVELAEGWRTGAQLKAEVGGVTGSLQGGHCHITGGSLPQYRGGHCHIEEGSLPHHRAVLLETHRSPC